MPSFDEPESSSLSSIVIGFETSDDFAGKLIVNLLLLTLLVARLNVEIPEFAVVVVLGVALLSLSSRSFFK